MTEDIQTHIHADNSVRANFKDIPMTASVLPVPSFDQEENDSKNIKSSENDCRRKEMLQKRSGLRSIPAKKKTALNHCSSNFMTSNNAVHTLIELTKKRDDLAEQIKVLSYQVKPIEFESYHEYFLINTFRKGISASGHVDVDNLRRKNHGKYYKRIKRGPNTTTTKSVSSSPASSNNSLSDEDDADNDNERDKQNTDDQDLYNEDNAMANDEINTGSKRRTRAQAAAKKETKKSSPSQETLEQAEQKLINGDISLASIIPTAKSEGTRRRSSRLTQRTNENSILGISDSSMMADEESFTNIRDLYESLVPKVKDPYRRSDWILPSKQRYTPEKQMQTKPVFEKVKINELVTSGRIRYILSKFEGGVAGVRKRG